MHGRPPHLPASTVIRERSEFMGATVRIFYRVATMLPIPNQSTANGADQCANGQNSGVLATEHERHESRKMSDFVSAPVVSDARQILERLHANMRVTIKGKDDVIAFWIFWRISLLFNGG